MALNETQDVTKPAGSRDRSLGDDDIREFKRAEAERNNVGHIRPADETGESNVGHHRSIKMVIVEGADPSNAANVGWLYLKDVSAKVELFWQDEDGNVVQLTTGGVLNALGSFRTDDLLHSFSAVTPSGWTDVTATYNGKFMRVSTGAAKTTGGADTHDHGGASGSTTLTSAQSGLVAHLHTTQAGETGGAASDGSQAWASGVPGSGKNSGTVAAANAASGHTHTVSSVNNIPAYVQCKLYEKD